MGRSIALQDDGKSISKNTRLGEVLVKFYSGSHTYKVPDAYRRKIFHENVVEIHNRSNYVPTDWDPSELEIRISGESAPYRYQRLSLLMDAAKAEAERIRKQQAELKRIEEEKRRIEQELAEKKAKEEQERLEAEKKRKEEEEKKRRKEIERLEQQYAETLKKENPFARSCVRTLCCVLSIFLINTKRMPSVRIFMTAYLLLLTAVPAPGKLPR